MKGLDADFYVWQANHADHWLRQSERRNLSPFEQIASLSLVLAAAGPERTRIAVRKYFGYLAGCIFDRATGECRCDVWKRS